MSATTDLDAAVAQRLFGWHWEADAQLWRDPDGVYRDAMTFRRRLPAYSLEPRATALVWQWLEAQGRYFRLEYLAWEDVCGYRCAVFDGPPWSFRRFEGAGASWPEALCRAALALATALEQGEGEETR